MKRLSRWFINGLLAILPISITVYVTWWIASLAEGVFGAPLRSWMGVRAGQTGGYFFGLGLIVMIAVLILVGLFLEFYLGKLQHSGPHPRREADILQHQGNLRFLQSRQKSHAEQLHGHRGLV